MKGDNSSLSEFISVCNNDKAEELPADMAELLERYILENPKRIAALKAGKEETVDFFVGPLMKANNRRVEPSRLRPLVLQMILKSKG